jgi:hypothetical protein
MLFNKLRATKAWKELDNEAEKSEEADAARRKLELSTIQ